MCRDGVTRASDGSCRIREALSLREATPSWVLVPDAYHRRASLMQPGHPSNMQVRANATYRTWAVHLDNGSTLPLGLPGDAFVSLMHIDTNTGYTWATCRNRRVIAVLSSAPPSSYRLEAPQTPSTYSFDLYLTCCSTGDLQAIRHRTIGDQCQAFRSPVRGVCMYRTVRSASTVGIQRLAWHHPLGGRVRIRYGLIWLMHTRAVDNAASALLIQCQSQTRVCRVHRADSVQGNQADDKVSTHVEPRSLPVYNLHRSSRSHDRVEQQLAGSCTRSGGLVLRRHPELTQGDLYFLRDREAL
ncbi:uncharacterized protein C8Q71DRAFT_41483 [Rhodofomes roseus]|uniref:Uncharacterized protein n=1 Tax=Rhodofomes roseus TaxID=34475 RepID=A0ABQ8KYH6_9APHY|nr:uncharacterized protein C8Q71DRAFT_41483 [Rhodofomes roseus]KAH9844347.1 hypothetical protein C8Q71DRAFT_41483 [Rhodofomes roseus]